MLGVTYVYTIQYTVLHIKAIENTKTTFRSEDNDALVMRRKHNVGWLEGLGEIERCSILYMIAASYIIYIIDNVFHNQKDYLYISTYIEKVESDIKLCVFEAISQGVLHW